LKDDLLDVYGDKKKFGKRVGGDILSNKKTFLLIEALTKARGKDKSELNRWLSARKFDSKKKVAGVTAIYDRLNVRKLTEAAIQSYFQEGFAALQKLSASEKIDSLVTFARDLADRQS
jgi:geranylgeranyl diphosphate synthase type II